MRYSQWIERHLDVVTGPSYSGEYDCRCPITELHAYGDRSPSFRINGIKGLYMCHACGTKGHIRSLAQRLDLTLEETPPDPGELLANIRSLLEPEPVRFLTESWLAQFTVHDDEIAEYWQGERGLSPETIERFKLGYDPARRAATIPLRTFHGQCIGVLRRRLAKKARPRYLEPKGFRKQESLFASHEAIGSPFVVVTEGTVDALAIWDVGLPAVALYGSHVSKHHVTMLKKLGSTEFVIAADNDDAGQKMATMLKVALQRSYRVTQLRYSGVNASDPAEVAKAVRKQWVERQRR